MKEADLLAKFLEMEGHLQLFEKEICGIYVWRLIRRDLFKTLLNINNGVTASTTSRRRSKKDIILDAIVSLKNSCFNSAFLSNKQTNVLFFENPRKVKRGSTFYDPYSSYYIEEFKKTSTSSFEVVDIGFNGKHFQQASAERKFADNFYYDYVVESFRKIKPKPLNVEERTLLELIQKEIFEQFNLTINVEAIYVKAKRVFVYENQKFGKLFDLRQPKEIFIVCSYGKEGMIAAAKSRQIKVSEFQHGMIDNYHLGYSFPATLRVHYFPDRILMFGKIWSEISSLPLHQVEVEYIGYPHLTENFLQYATTAKREKSVLVLSQPTLANMMSMEALSIAKENPDFDVTFRLHPRELLDWKTKYPELLEQQLANFKVDEVEKPLHELIVQNEFMISVQSTAIFEALALGAKIIILNLGNNERMGYLIDKKYVFCPENSEGKIDFIGIAENFIFTQVEQGFVFHQHQKDSKSVSS